LASATIDQEGTLKAYVEAEEEKNRAMTGTSGSGGSSGVSMFSTPTRYKVVKIACSNFEVVLRNYEAHGDLSWFRPLL
jgi:hypothetical protein